MPVAWIATGRIVVREVSSKGRSRAGESMRAEGVLSRTNSETYFELIFIEWLCKALFSWGQVTFFQRHKLLNQV